MDSCVGFSERDLSMEKSSFAQAIKAVEQLGGIFFPVLFESTSGLCIERLSRGGYFLMEIDDEDELSAILQPLEKSHLIIYSKIAYGFAAINADIYSIPVLMGDIHTLIAAIF
ncbi:hypothetical protein R6Q59_032733 [Mikania micrantha]